MASNENKSWPTQGYRPEWLAMEDAMGGRAILPLDLAVITQSMNTIFASLDKQWPPVEGEIDVSDENIKSKGGNIDVRIYKPKTKHLSSLVVWLSGGGFIAGNLDTEDHHCRYFAAKTPCLVISVNYPRAPETKIDETVNATIKALEWSKARADAIMTGLPTFLAGGSAGATISMNTAYRLKILGQNHLIDGLVLLFPSTSHWDHIDKYKSMHTSWEENSIGHPFISRSVCELIWPNVGLDPTSPFHFTFLAEDLSGFPPAYIVCAGFDCFRDDGVVLAHRLHELAIPAKLDMYQGLPHYFHVFSGLEVASECLNKTVEGIRWLVSPGKPL